MHPDDPDDEEGEDDDDEDVNFSKYGRARMHSCVHAHEDVCGRAHACVGLTGA